MKKSLIFAIILSGLVSSLFAQKDVKKGDKKAETVKTAKTDVAADKAALELAQAAVKAHGGDKFKNEKTMIVSGSVDITTTAFNQTFPATFITILSGDKYRIEINNPYVPFKQVYDGEQTSSTLKGGFTLPPINRLGFPLLSKIGDTNFPVSALPDSKKKNGFRVTSPEGFYTDFFLDEKTNQVKSFEASYDIDGRAVTTSVEIDKYREVDGVFLPEKYAQRFDMDQMTVYAAFKAKDISINKEVADDVFKLVNNETK